MVPEKQWRDKGDMMDKRTARKVHGLDFCAVITTLRREWADKRVKNQDRDADDSPESADPTGIQLYGRKRPMLAPRHDGRARLPDIRRYTATLNCLASVLYPPLRPERDMKRKFIESHVHMFSNCYC